MPVVQQPPGDRTLPGPGIYRLDGSGAGIFVCLVKLADMVRHFLPAVNPHDYAKMPGRVFAGDPGKDGFLSAGEIRQVNCFRALKKQLEWIGGRYALKKLVAAALPNDNRASRVRVAYEPWGAPYLDNIPGISISISHAGDYAVAGLCSDSDSRIGLDIERLDQRALNEVVKVAFTEREIELAGGSREQICRIWTRKEAYLKFIKIGFRENLKRVDVAGRPIVHGGVPVAGLGIMTLRVAGQYHLSVVSGQR